VSKVQRLSGDRSGLELRLACLADEKRRADASVAAAQAQTASLELSRRTADARAASHQDRAQRLATDASVSIIPRERKRERERERGGASGELNLCGSLAFFGPVLLPPVNGSSAHSLASIAPNLDASLLCFC
jgi:hypothetical protein